MKRCAVCAIVAAALCSTANGGTIDSSWNGGSGNWSTAAYWTPAGVPNNANGNVSDVIIASGNSIGDSVLLDESPTIDSLVIGGSGSHSLLYTNFNSPQNLTVNGALTINSGSSLELRSGTLSAGAMANTGSFDLYGGTATITGNLALAQGGSVYLGRGATLNLTNSIADIPAGGGVFVEGTTNALAGLASIEGYLNLYNGQSTTITPNGGTLAIAGRHLSYLAVEGSGTGLTIAGNLTNASSSSVFVDAGSTLTVNGTLANQATNGQYFEIDGTVNANTLVNSGYMHVVSGGTIYAGSVTNGSGATLTLDGASGSTPGGVLDLLKYTSGGSTSVGSGATLVVGSGTVPSGTTGLYAFSNGTLAELLFGSPNSGNTCTGSASDCGIINVAGNVTLSGTLDPLLQNGFDPMNGDSFIFLTFSGALSGQFSSIDRPEHGDHISDALSGCSAVERRGVLRETAWLRHRAPGFDERVLYCQPRGRENQSGFEHSGEARPGAAPARPDVFDTRLHRVCRNRRRPLEGRATDIGSERSIDFPSPPLWARGSSIESHEPCAYFSQWRAGGRRRAGRASNSR